MTFSAYSRWYDLLYREKNYAGEAKYASALFAPPLGMDILEIGCGTGRFTEQLLALGWNPHGLDVSSEMLEIARTRIPSSTPLICADARSFQINKQFPAVISLFHVFSYLTTDADLLAAFNTVREHLAPGGTFVFDVWHGPGVVASPPGNPTKIVSDEDWNISRKTVSKMLDGARVSVEFHITATPSNGEKPVELNEIHMMRYWFPEEIRSIATSAGMEVAEIYASGSHEAPTSECWFATYVLHKKQ